MSTSAPHAIPSGTPAQADARHAVLTVNAGSSSIKFALFDTRAALRRTLEGAIERIGLAGTVLKVNNNDTAQNVARTLAVSDYGAAIAELMGWLEENIGRGSLAAVGHRVVHGGPKFNEPERVTAEMLDALRELSPFDPQHLPPEILLIERFRERFPDVAHIVCFDTAFHHDLPQVAQRFAIPRRYADQGVRRYGFHGLSYSYLMEALARLAGRDAAAGRVILAHLGNGASLAAVHRCRPVDTSMGFTPASGIPMSTRSGDLDPGMVWYLARKEHIDARAWNDMVNFESGLLGVSETSSDLRDLLVRESEDARAAEAIALFCYSIKKCVGAYAAALGGLDTLVFSGGIGENAVEVRRRICEGLGFLGIELSDAKNAAGDAVISADTSRVTVRVVATDEEWMIAKLACRALGMAMAKAHE